MGLQCLVHENTNPAVGINVVVLVDDLNISSHVQDLLSVPETLIIMRPSVVISVIFVFFL
jgi:hypothetical protein